MIRLVIVKNPFQPWQGREIKNIPNGFNLRQAVDLTEFKGMEINCVVNGKVVEMVDNYMLPDNDIVVLSPMVAKGGKSILGIVAMIGLAIATGGILSGGLAGTLGSAFAAGTVGAYAAAAAVMFIGSTLIGKLTAVKADTGNFSNDNDQTYSWNGVQTMEGQNNPIVMTYGKVKSAGQTIGKNITVNDNKEYLNWLIAAGEGPLEITNVQLNDNSTDYYDGVEVEIREGTNDQSIIPYFNDTYFTKNLGYQLLDDERIDTAQGNATEKITVKIEFTNGLYYAKDNGKLGDAWVRVGGSYRLKNTTTWTGFFEETITASQSSAVRKEFSTNKLTPGEYEVKVKVMSRQYEVTNSRASTRCWWSSVTSVVYDDFTYPNIALIGINALATDQISGTPSLSFVKERAKVWVWNPYTNLYEQRNANNPAWASYDMLHLCNRLKNINTNQYEYEVRGAAKDLLLYDQFNEWATFCDSMDLEVNIEITQAGELLEIINQNIANCGRGQVIRYGTRYGCVWDAVKQPVQMFGMGNIVSGTFREEFIQTSDRANCVEITYNDAEMDYTRNTITIYSDDYDNAPEEKIAQSTYNGITSYEQAYREGKYQLYCNKYLLRTVSFDAYVDAIACTVGDVILVSHDVPKWAYSGRIYSVDKTNNNLTLPVEIEDTTKNYRVMYRTVNDNLVTSNITILSNANGWCTVHCGTAFSATDPPQANDVFDVAITNIGSKPFVVKSISRSSEFIRKISCLEYNENVYSENYEIPPVDYSIIDSAAENVTNLVARQTRTIDDNGVYQYLLEASWEYGSAAAGQKAGTFALYGSYDGYNYIPLATGITERSYANMLPNQLTYFRVVTRNGLKYSSGVTVGVEKLNILVMPECQNVHAYNKYREFKDGIIRYDIVVEWDVPAFAGYQQAQVWYKNNNGGAVGVAVTNDLKPSEIGYTSGWLYGGQGYSSVVIPQAIIGDTYQIAVCTQDSLGNVMDPDSVTNKISLLVAGKTETPDTPNNIGTEITDVFTVFWDEVRNSDILYYEVRTDTSVGNVGNAYLGRTTDSKFSTNAITERNGKLYVFAISAYSKASAPAIIEYHYGKPKAPVLELEAKVQGIQCKANGLPVNCTGIHWYFEAGSNIADVISPNVTHFHSCQHGVYSVYACYVDYFGNGTMSESSMITIKQYIDPALIQEASLGANLLNQSAQQALSKAVNSLQNGDIEKWWDGDTAQAIRGEKQNYYTTTQVDGIIETKIGEIGEGTIAEYVRSVTPSAVQEEITRITNQGDDGVLSSYATKSYTDTEISSNVSSIRGNYAGSMKDLSNSIQTTNANVSSVQQTAESINNIVARLSNMASSETFNGVKKYIHGTLTVGQVVTWSANSTSLEFYIDVLPNEVYSVSLFGGNSESWKVWFTDNNNKVIVRGCKGINFTGTTGNNGDNNKLVTNSSTANFTKISDTVTVPKNNSITRMWLFTRCTSDQTINDVSKWASVQKVTYSAITQLADGIQLKVNGSQKTSSINLTEGTITLDTSLLTVGGTYKDDNGVEHEGLTTISDGAIKTDMLDAKCVTAGKINVTDLGAVSATIGHIRTASSGARVEIGRLKVRPNLLEVIDENGTVRIELGVF